MANDGFPDAWLRAECVKLYGDPIANSTWAKWKKICRVTDFRAFKNQEHLINKTNAQWLLMLAWMKSEQKRQNGTKAPVGRGAGITLDQVIKRLNSNPVLKQKVSDALGDAVLINGVLGKEVPTWLSIQVGKRPHIRTIRRWAKNHNIPFSLNEEVLPKHLNVFLQLA